MEFPKNVSFLNYMSELRITLDIAFLQIQTRISAIRTKLTINIKIKIKDDMLAKKLVVVN